MNIEQVSTTSLDDVLPLIAEYQRFYGVSKPDYNQNLQFFSQFASKQSENSQFLYRDSKGEALGFATVYFTFSSVRACKIAVLNDLFTIESARGKGVGRALIEYCREYAANLGVTKFQWSTAKDNYQAQALYNTLPTKRSEWFIYSYPT